MRNEPRQHRAVAQLLEILDVRDTGARTTEDIFTGRSQPMPTRRIYGGQVLAQAIVAAEHTLADGRALHSMHGYFLRPGDSTQGTTITVDRIHDGRSFSTRRSQAYQNGVPIFSMIASFQDEGTGVEHSAEFPADVPAPESLRSDDDYAEDEYSLLTQLVHERPVDVRHVHSPLIGGIATEAQPHQMVWMRLRSAMPDDPGLHRAALAYLSDMTIQESVLRAHGLRWDRPGLKVASLDHAMWWYRPARVDEWLLYVQQSPTARGGRGLATGNVFTRDGALAAVVAQEIMIRVPDTVE